jgi:lipopolysaccharide transport system permease protein
MASLTSNASVADPRSARAAGLPSIRIEPPRGWFDLRIRELLEYHELLYFFVWRDVKIRYKQTAIGVVWVILQPVLTMLVAWLFAGFALSCFFFCWCGPLDLFLRGAGRDDQRRR